MRHIFECPTRWADLDLLGHVNNVVYVDYLQEARVDMLRTHRGIHQRSETTEDLAEGVVVVRHEVNYVAPLEFSFRPVKIEIWVSEIRAASFTVAYEVFHDAGEGIGPDETDPHAHTQRQVYLRAMTVLTPYVFGAERPRRLTLEERARLEEFLEATPRERTPSFKVSRRDEGNYPVHVRFSDVDVYRHVNNVKYFEYFQEARIRQFAALTHDLSGPRLPMVVARTDVDYRMPILLRLDPYDCWSQVGAVGRRSFAIESEICDGDQVLSRARVVLVFFDPETGRSVEPAPELRERLLSQTTPDRAGATAPDRGAGPLGPPPL